MKTSNQTPKISYRPPIIAASRAALLATAAALVVVAPALHAQSYQNNFETPADLNDFTIDSPVGFSVGVNARGLMAGEAAYLYSNSQVVGTPSSLVLNSGLGIFANFQNTGDTATFSLWHIGTGSEPPPGPPGPSDFSQFLGFATDESQFYGSGNLFGVYGDITDGDSPPGGMLGSFLSSGSGATKTLVTGPFGDSAAIPRDDDSWNRFTASFIYDAGTDQFFVNAAYTNHGLDGTDPGVLIATMNTTLSAAGWSGQKLLPAFGLTDLYNDKEAYDRFEFSFTPIPEPSSALLCGLTATLALMRRRRVA